MTSISSLHNRNREHFIICLFPIKREKVPIYPIKVTVEQSKQTKKIENGDEGYIWSSRAMSISKGSHIEWT